MELCRHIRWKSFHGQRNWSEPELLETVARNEEPYSCLSTMQPWGPDDAPCALDRCGADRTCYQPSARLRRAVS